MHASLLKGERQIGAPLASFLQGLLLLDVVSMDPAVLLLAVLSFEEGVLIVFASHHSHA
jgi:hypothetical protein